MMRTVVGAVLGGVAGTGLGFVVYMVLRELVIPTSLWSSDGIMWGIIVAVAAAMAVFGARAGKTGGTRQRGGSTGLRIVVGVFLGFIAGAVGALVLSMLAAVVFNISQREGAYAMGVAFFYMPVGALVGAVTGAVLAARRPKAATGTEV